MCWLRVLCADMDIVRAVVRIERATKKPAIFYFDEFNGLTCYTFADGHTEADIKYYRTNTKPAEMPKDIEACERLVKHYALICAKHKEMLVIGKRLTRK